MLDGDAIEDLICLVATMDRATLLRQFREYPAPFPLDFTPEFFDSVPLDRLRHIFVALCLQCRHVPDLAEATAA